MTAKEVDASAIIDKIHLEEDRVIEQELSKRGYTMTWMLRNSGRIFIDEVTRLDEPGYAYCSVIKVGREYDTEIYPTIMFEIVVTCNMACDEPVITIGLHILDEVDKIEGKSEATLSNDKIEC